MPQACRSAVRGVDVALMIAIKLICLVDYLEASSPRGVNNGCVNDSISAFKHVHPTID